MKRILLAALVGATVVFLWGAVSHMALPLGELGLSQSPAEAEVVATLRAKLPDAGLYFLPDMRDVAPEQLPSSGPTAFLAWRPDAPYTMGANLAVEFLSGLGAALVAAFVIARGFSGASLLKKALVSAGLGVFGWLSIAASYWTWYGFSTGFFVGEGVQQAAGWFLAGLAMAPLAKKPGGS